MSNEVWFTADSHLRHDAIRTLGRGRPFSSVEEMDEVLLDNLSSVLRPGDTLYHLGDVGLRGFKIEQLMDRIPGVTVHLVLGNHDDERTLKHRRVAWIGHLKRIWLPGKEYCTVLCHYPMRSWESKNRGGLHLFGHCHGSLPNWDRSMDVGVDTNEFRPYHWTEVVKRLKDVPVFGGRDGDHHNRVTETEEETVEK